MKCSMCGKDGKTVTIVVNYSKVTFCKECLEKLMKEIDVLQDG